VASQLGATVRRVHDLACPDEPVWQRDVVGELRATCAERHRRRGMLPAYLVDQIDDYLAAPSSAQRLVHGDLHADHIFVDEARLVGVIEGGDALWGDPYYELPALFFGTFGESKPLLRAFNRAARAWTGVRHRPAAVRAGRAFPGGSKRARTHRGDVRGAGTGAGWHRPASVQRSSNDPFARLSFPTLSWAG